MIAFSKLKNNKNARGFTLIELMVAMSVFVVVITMSIGSIVSIFNANQKSKNLRSVMDNLNITLETMTRTIRFGKNYHCNSTAPASPFVPRNCGGAGDTTFTLLAADGVTKVTYARVAGPPGRITRSINGGTAYNITSPDVDVTALTFRVYGADPWVSGSTSCNAPNDCLQPQVVIVISGNVGTKVSTRSSFVLETMVSQRLIDFQ